jgi:hypothetical protein
MTRLDHLVWTWSDGGIEAHYAGTAYNSGRFFNIIDGTNRG